MSKDDLEIDDDFIDDDNAVDEPEAVVDNGKGSLTKRRIIDNLLEERRLNKELAEYDYDIE